jgi:hypothetical protein
MVGNDKLNREDLAGSMLAQATALNKNTLPSIPADAKNVHDFGAIGDGAANDTAAIQMAVDAAAASNGNVVIPQGIYMINALQSIQLRSHVNLYMTDQTILKAIPNQAKFYVVLTIQNISQVKVFGGVIQGERNQHQGTTGQWGTGIQISGAKDVLIQGTRSEECWGDGFYIGTEVFTGPNTWKVLNAVPENIQLIDVVGNHNRRQGISIIAGRNVELIRPVLLNTVGQDPEGGLDIEPNKVTDTIENISVVDAITGKNHGAGIQIFLARLAGTATPVSVKIANHHDDGSKRGLSIVERNGIVAGNLLVENSQWDNNIMNGLKIENHDHRSYHIDINNCTVVNANRGGLKSENVNGASIAIVHATGYVDGRTGCIGNITIKDPILDDMGDTLLTVAPFHIWDAQPGYVIEDLSIINPLIRGKLKTIPIYVNVKPYIHNID